MIIVVQTFIFGVKCLEALAQSFSVCTILAMEETRGRPELPKNDRRETRFQIRLSATELALVERAADGKTSTWARKTLLAAAKRRLNGK
jgi:hypothetical protein